MIAAPHPSMASSSAKRKIQGKFSAIVAIVAALLSIVLFVPLMPVMPKLGLDPSWNLAINEAAARGMQFGKDVLYTAGPLSNVWTQAYHPATIHLAFVAGLILALGHTFLVYRIALASRPAWFWLFVAVVAFFMVSRDTLFLVYPLLLVIVSFRVSLPITHQDKIELTRSDCFLLLLAGTGLGLLPILKLSFLPLAVISWVFSSILLWLSKYRLMAGLMLVMPVLGMIVFWVLAGQELVTLPDYFANNAPVVSGFTRAMSNRFFLLTPALYLLSSVLALYLVYRYLTDNGGILALIILMVVAAFLFLSFKAGFVRQDVHALTAGSSIVMGMVILGSFRAIGYRLVVAGMVSAIMTWLLIHIQFSSASFEYYKSPAARVVTSLRAQILDDQSFSSWRDQYDARLKEISEYVPIPKLEGSVDIYPYQVAALIASQNAWSPRPVFQSFSAYTPELSEANVAHLTGQRAPDHILFELGSIDGRYPSMEDGASWPVLLAAYDISGVTNHYLVLGRKETQRSVPPLTPIASRTARFGERVDVANNGHIIVAELAVHSSPLGKIMNLFYKQSLLMLSVELSNGEVRRHRFVPGQASAGFILSPYVDRLEGFAGLWSPLEDEGPLLSVRGFRLDELPDSPSMWMNEYAVSLYELDRAAIHADGGPRQ